MIKIEAVTLEAAYKDAASKLECSVTELTIEVVQAPSKGILGLFKKSAIIVAVREMKKSTPSESNKTKNIDKRVNSEFKDESTKVQKVDKREALKPNETLKKEKQKVPTTEKKSQTKQEEPKQQQKKRPKKQKNKAPVEQKESHTMLNDTIMPASFVSMQEEEDEYDVSSYLADYDEGEEDCEECKNISEIADTVAKEINELFDLTCFKIEAIDVRAHDENTLLVEFKGEDAALLIGKEGYRYKALSYMIFNWINTKYQVQLRLEIAEFLKNQEETI